MIVAGSTGDASRLLPLLASDTSSGEIVGLVFNGLLKYDEQLNIVGDLAKLWDVSDDGLTITFHLREGVPVLAPPVWERSRTVNLSVC